VSTWCQLNDTISDILLNSNTGSLLLGREWICEGIAGSEGGGGRSHLGYDRVFAVNYLGHFLLVNRLLPLLVQSTPSRVVSVTSISHSFLHESLFDDESQSQTVGHTGRRAFCRRLAGYPASKLAMVLHVKELSRRLGGM